jgi:hypothetical protein
MAQVERERMPQPPIEGPRRMRCRAGAAQAMFDRLIVLRLVPNVRALDLLMCKGGLQSQRGRLGVLGSCWS